MQSESNSTPRARWLRVKQLCTRLRHTQLAPVLGAASAGALVGWAALIWGPGSEPETQRSQPVPTYILQPAPQSTPGPQPSAAAVPGTTPAAPVPSAPAARTASSTAPGSDDIAARIQALRSARERGDVAELPQLLELELAREPDAAPTVIGVATELAQRAEPQLKATAATRFGEWLRDESQRASSDARANVSVLVEALGKLDAPEAGAALIEALDAERLPVHVASLAVQGLARHGDARARAAVERFRARLREAPETDDAFALELQAEAEQTADRALAALTH
jgi:hypothetical protein